MPNPVVHWEIYSPNCAASTKFYSELFGWEITKHEPIDYYLASSGGQNGAPGISGGIMQVQEGMKPGITFYVGVDDLQKFLDKAEALGGKTIMGPHPIPGTDSSIAMFTDPNGQMIGLYKG